MAFRRDALSRPTTNVSRTVTWIVIGSVLLSFVVLPVVILWLGAYGGRAALNMSMVTYGIISMVPGVLLGATSLLVMLGGGS